MGKTSQRVRVAASEIVQCGGRSSQRAQVGGEATHLRPWVLGRETAVWTPKIYDFWGQLLKIKAVGPLGRQLLSCVPQGYTPTPVRPGSRGRFCVDFVDFVGLVLVYILGARISESVKLNGDVLF